MRDGLYHADVYMPEAIKASPSVLVNLRYSKHAVRASQNDRYGAIERLPIAIIPNKGEMIEVEVSGGMIVKRVIRFPYSETHDLVIVVTVPEYTVKTVWLNEKNDLHNTLDTSKYIGG